MINFLLILAFAAAASASVISLPKTPTQNLYKELITDLFEKSPRNPITVNINEYLDDTLKVVRLWIVKSGLDPIEVDAVEKDFSLWIGFVRWHGEFAVNHGWMQGLNIVQRSGEAEMKYDTKILQIWLPVSFDTILVNYDYKIKFMSLGPSGGVEGKIKNLKLIIDIAVNTATLEFTLQGFKIADAGKITIRFSGNPLVDILTNIITSRATTILHDIALGVIQNQVRDRIEDALDSINNSLHPSSPIYY